MVKVRYQDILARTDRAILFLIAEREIWLPVRYLRFGQGRTMFLPLWLAREKSVDYREAYHHPVKMKIENVEVIQELILMDRFQNNTEYKVGNVTLQVHERHKKTALISVDGGPKYEVDISHDESGEIIQFYGAPYDITGAAIFRPTDKK